MTPIRDFPPEIAGNLPGCLLRYRRHLHDARKDTTRGVSGPLVSQGCGAARRADTGLLAGWCDHIARMWPVDGVVGENGALYFWYDAIGEKGQSDGS